MIKSLKIKENLLLLSAAMVTLSFSQEVSAQIAVGTAESNWGGGHASVQNTGNYITDYLGSGIDLGVAVWDGADPALSWEFNGSAGTIYTSYNDPDIALTHSGECAAIVFESGGEIYVEGYKFDPSTPQLIHISGPTMVSNGTGTSSNPNIDGGNGYLGAIVWSEDNGGVNTIYTRTVEICGTTLYPTVAISGVLGAQDCTEPDVSIYEDGGNIYYNYTYVSYSPTNLWGQLIHHIEDETAITSGSQSMLYITDPYPFYGLANAPSQPRIVSHHSNIGSNYVDASAIAFTVSVDRDVWTYTTIAGLHNLTGAAVPSLSASTSCINHSPAISWTNSGNFTVGWSYRGNCTPGGAGINWDLISVQLDQDGFPVTTDVNDYQWVNDFTPGRQLYLSLSSRFSALEELFTSFYSQSTGEIMYKYTLAGASPYFINATSGETAAVNGNLANQSLSSGNLLNESFFNVYPNPASDVLSVEGDGITSLVMYNTSGQIVYSLEKDNLIDQSVLNISLADLSSGIYFLKVNGNEKVHTEKIIIEK